MGRPEQQSLHLPTIALEGLGGCGKSSASDLLRRRFCSEGINSQVFKIGGLGFGNKLDRLRQIRAYRQEVMESEGETEKQKTDRLKDQIYGLAAYYQAKKLAMAQFGGIKILDRTPFVGWAYARARQLSTGEGNPYLDNIFQRNATLCNLVGINQVYYLDVSIETAYARTLSRYFTGSGLEENLDQIIKNLSAPRNVATAIKEKTMMILLGNGQIQPKQFESWHFPPYSLMQVHRDTFLEALDRGKRQCGYDIALIDAEADVQTVVSAIYGKVS